MPFVFINLVADERQSAQSFAHVEIEPGSQEAHFAFVVAFHVVGQLAVAVGGLGLQPLEEEVHLAHQAVVIHPPVVLEELRRFARTAPAVGCFVEYRILGDVAEALTPFHATVKVGDGGFDQRVVGEYLVLREDVVGILVEKIVASRSEARQQQRPCHIDSS